MAFERSLVILKPDCVCRGLMGEVLSRFERKGLRVVAMKITMVAKAKAEEHYAEHKGKPFYPGLVDFITSAPVVLLSLEGVNAIEVIRKILGKTNGAQAEPGSIRGDFGISRRNNLVHASDSPTSAERELKLYFDSKDFVKYDQAELKWTYDWSGANPE
ncbi:MAG TPA: nucleoside-diphosphate kinase [Planctomycetota bacterium]|jgi:nucleoside-diphosphate kinase|nr:nucleoside-diphosphate kinase [Planctomycetota bacterium]